MEVKQGYSYHINDEFFELVQDKYLMGNKEEGFITRNYYVTDEKWKKNAILIGRANRDIKKKYEEGANKLGVSKSRAKDALGHTRNELTHYEFKRSSLGSFISDSSKETDNMVYLYAFYILDLALRVSLLETIGVIVDDKIKEYLLDEHLDWIRLERHLEEDCAIPQNVLKQILLRLQEDNC